MSSDSETDSSSADEAEQQRLNDAVIKPSDLLHTKHNKEKIHAKTENREAHLPSLRQKDEDKPSNSYLNTTPEFRQFVAKKLSQMLDKDIETGQEEKEIEQDLGSDTGIRLFMGSKRTLTTENDSESASLIKKQKKPDLLKKYKKRNDSSSSSSSSEEYRRLSEAAVSCDFIIQQSCQGLTSACSSKDNVIAGEHKTVEKKSDNTSDIQRKKKKKKHKKEIKIT